MGRLLQLRRESQNGSGEAIQALSSTEKWYVGAVNSWL